jgi:osmoprotectant transport system ATP-binding protein
MITLAGVSKIYDGLRVVDRLDLEIAAGSICVIVGPSGCGKSTTLRMINALIAADEGRIIVNGQDVREADPASLRRGIGYVIQSAGLFPHWSIADNIATVPRLLGWPRDRIAARVAELIRLVGLDDGDMAQRRPHQLSGGQQQRVGVARALAADPPILLMDEPFGALDPVTRRALQDELIAIHRATAKTIVLVTHDMDEALKLGERIVVMEEGRIVQDGSPAAIATAPVNDLVRDFVGGEEAALRLLARGTVADVMRPPGAARQTATIEPGATLGVALARMVASGHGELGVRDEAGREIGVIALADLAPGRRP